VRIRQIRRDEHAGPDDGAAASRPVAPAGGEHVTAAPNNSPPHRYRIRVRGRLGQTMRDVKVTMEDLVISGDRVVGRFTYRGTHTGDLVGIPASGKPVEMRSIDIWRVQNGMFAEHWDEINAMQMFQQIGALPPLGGLLAQA
jgi:predicted ester cyclase